MAPWRCPSLAGSWRRSGIPTPTPWARCASNPSGREVPSDCRESRRVESRGGWPTESSGWGGEGRVKDLVVPSGFFKKQKKTGGMKGGVDLSKACCRFYGCLPRGHALKIIGWLNHSFPVFWLASNPFFWFSTRLFLPAHVVSHHFLDPAFFLSPLSSWWIPPSTLALPDSGLAAFARYPRHGAFVEGAEFFDAKFFGISPPEARSKRTEPRAGGSAFLRFSAVPDGKGRFLGGSRQVLFGVGGPLDSSWM